MQPGYFGDAGGPEQYTAAQGWNIHPQHAQVNGSPQKAQDVTEIESRLNRVNDALERLSNRVSVLDDRLRPIMRGVGSGCDASLTAPKEALSPLGDSIRSIEYRVDRACEHLESMLAGLAL